jgi:hypothetical protein
MSMRSCQSRAAARRPARQPGRRLRAVSGIHPRGKGRPAVNRRGRIIGLVNQLTDSAATYDAHLLTSQTNAVLVGQPAEDPVDNYGSSDGLLRLRGSGIVIKYSTKTFDPHQIRMGIPDIYAAPAIGQIQAGQDPVL